MDTTALWRSVNALSDSWLLACGLPALLIVGARPVRLRAYLLPLVPPALLLLARKVALYVPVPGTFSSADRVVFWSPQAYGYFLLLVLPGLGLLTAAIWHWDEWFSYDDGAGASAIITAYCILWAAGGLALPVDGDCHLYMPLVSVVAAAKLVLVSPLLLPLVWIGIALQTGLLFSRARAAVPEMNKLLAACVFVAACGQIVTQPIVWASPVVRQVRESWPLPGGRERPAAAQDFLEHWAGKLAEIDNTGLNIVERDTPKAFEGKAGADRLMAAVPLPSNSFAEPGFLRLIALGCLGLALVMVLLERMPCSTE